VVGANARHQARREAGATEERRLYAVACKPLFGADSGRDARLPFALPSGGWCHAFDAVFLRQLATLFRVGTTHFDKEPLKTSRHHAPQEHSGLCADVLKSVRLPPRHEDECTGRCANQPVAELELKLSLQDRPVSLSVLGWSAYYVLGTPTIAAILLPFQPSWRPPPIS